MMTLFFQGSGNKVDEVLSPEDFWFTNLTYLAMPFKQENIGG